MFWDRLGANFITDFSRPKFWNASCVTREKQTNFLRFFQAIFRLPILRKTYPQKILKSFPKNCPKNIRNPLSKWVGKLSEIRSQNQSENRSKFYSKIMLKSFPKSLPKSIQNDNKNTGGFFRDNDLCLIHPA